MDKKMETARILNDFVMEVLDRPEPHLHPSDHCVVITSGGRLNGVGWMVSTVVRVDEKSVHFSVQLPGGRKGYATDILMEFVDANTIQKYAKHAWESIVTSNGFDLADF